MLDEHSPFKRIISDEATACDRQWLTMLKDAFSSVTHEGMVDAGFSSIAATKILGLVALKKRTCDNYQEAA